MNLEGCTLDRRLQPQVMPVLILINEWGTSEMSPLMDTDMILYLMHCIQLLYKDESSHVPTYEV